MKLSFNSVIEFVRPNYASHRSIPLPAAGLLFGNGYCISIASKTVICSPSCPVSLLRLAIAGKLLRLASGPYPCGRSTRSIPLTRSKKDSDDGNLLFS